MPTSNNYRPLIADLEREETDLDRRLADTRLLITKLRERSGRSDGSRRSVERQAAIPKTREGGSPTKRAGRGSATGMVPEAVRRNPGQRAQAYTTAIRGRVRQVSTTKDPDKLVHSTLSYLLSQKRVRRDGQGRYSAAAEK